MTLDAYTINELTSHKSITPFIKELIGHFRIPKILTFKMRPSEQPFLLK